MNVSTTDILISIPLIPLFFFGITWWLPWERWIPWDELPQGFLGAYLIYAALVAWHFKMPRWASGVLAGLGTILVANYLRQKIKHWSQN